MATDQAQAVEAMDESALASILEEPKETADEADETPDETNEEAAEEGQEEPLRYKLTVKNDKGEDEEVELTPEEMAKGYMLQADYTRKTQELSSQRKNLDAQYAKALQEQQSQAVDRINQLQELVIAQAAPELNGVDWVSLSVQDPAKFVQLQARQQQVNQTWQALEQKKAQHQQAKEQLLKQSVDEVFKASDEMLAKEIPGLDASKTGKLLDDLQRSIGWSRSDLSAAAHALASAGMHPGTLGQVLVLAHKAMQFDELKKAKPAALQKVAVAPKVLKPGSTQPKRDNAAAVDRLRKSGRIEDLARIL
jgi:hypothetical protein